MAKIARNESQVCGKLERGVGERAKHFSTYSRGVGGTENVGYSESNINLVDIGKPNAAESKRTPIDRLAPLYGNAGPNQDRDKDII